jgi:hypothetical protein
MIRSSEIGWRFRQAICFLSCANTPEKLKQLNAIVLGPQASPPARVEKNQESLTLSHSTKMELVLLDTGRRGRLRSQDDRI